MVGRRRVLLVLAGAAAVWGAGAARAVGSWGRAIEVPGLGALQCLAWRNVFVSRLCHAGLSWRSEEVSL